MSLTPMVNVDPYDITEYQDLPESVHSSENKFEILHIENDENIPTFTIQVMSVEECENLKFQSIEVNTTSDIYKAPLGDTSNTAGSALDRNENNKTKLVRPPSDLAVPTINCSNSLNVKTLKKKNYYKGRFQKTKTTKL